MTAAVATRRFAIMREPGAQARRRRDEVARVYAVSYSPRPKLVGEVAAATQPGALLAFLRDRYPAGHAQFAGGRLEWRSPGAKNWRPDDGDHGSHAAARRDWSVVVTLRNGANVHEHRLLAWKKS